MTLCLDVRNLVKHYSNKKIVKDLSFQVERGEIVGLLGPNGAGKTTTFYMTAGLMQPDGGQVFFNGTDVTFMPLHKRALMGMGYLAQEPSIFRGLTVEENVLAILELTSLSKKDRYIRLEELLRELHLTPLRKKKKQRLCQVEREDA